MILVTGATGIVGSHLVVELIKSGHKEIKILTRPKADRTALRELIKLNELDSDPLFFIDGDILDPLSLHHAMKGCNEVYHAAAKVSFSAKDRKNLYEVNVTGTANVVNACIQSGVKNLCYISSTASIGDQPVNGLFTEESEWTTDRNKSHYSLSKRYAEMEVIRGREEGLNTLIVNPCVVVGPGRWGESSTEIFIACARGMRFYPPGSNAFVDARDIAEFCVSGMKSALFKGRYLLVGENLSFKSYFTLICKELDSTQPSIGVSKTLVKSAEKAVRFIERMNLNPLSITSENLVSAGKSPIYSASRAQESGWQFRSIAEAVNYTAECYKRSIKN